MLREGHTPTKLTVRKTGTRVEIKVSRVFVTLILFSAHRLLTILSLTML